MQTGWGTQNVRRWVTAGMMFGAIALSIPAQAKPTADTVLELLPKIALADLPQTGKKTYALIFEGGPFPYEKDGSVFGNYERLLPRYSRGYYREYTVRTPGRSGRGAKRIVCGGWKPVLPDACYYTHDHYASFRKIVE